VRDPPTLKSGLCRLHSTETPIPVAERSKARVCGRSLAGVAGSNPAGAWMSIYREYCVLSRRGLCDRPIPRPEESYLLWRV
jgi:hypothetical protein